MVKQPTRLHVDVRPHRVRARERAATFLACATLAYMVGACAPPAAGELAATDEPTVQGAPTLAAGDDRAPGALATSSTAVAPRVLIEAPPGESYVRRARSGPTSIAVRGSASTMPRGTNLWLVLEGGHVFRLMATFPTAESRWECLVMVPADMLRSAQDLLILHALAVESSWWEAGLNDAGRYSASQWQALLAGSPARDHVLVYVNE